MKNEDWRNLSHWWRQMVDEGSAPPVRPSLTGSQVADVCIVGSGYSGLWTAYELLTAKPGLSVVLLDAEFVGYGASGRNGGAVIAQLNGSRAFWASRGGRDAAIAMERVLQGTVTHVADTIEKERIDCSLARNGVIMVARNKMEAEMFSHTVAEDRRWGFGPEDSRYLSADEVAGHINVAGAKGARFSSHCASVNPARLVTGLAETVERMGAVIYENSRVTQMGPRRVVTAGGAVEAKYVIRATEAYTQSIPSERNKIVPVFTSMIVTDPVPDAIWAQIGWDRREALLTEHPFLHLQHTADHRITIGGDDPRVPYQWNSVTSSADGAPPEHVTAYYHRELLKLFPALKEVPVSQAWQGVFGTTRRWAPGVNLDPATGLGSLGGYVGEGVAVSNMAARTMAGLILGEDNEFTRLPWVGLQARQWEPEPLRYVGAQVIWAMRFGGDYLERAARMELPVIALGNRLAGFTGHLG